MSREYAVRMGGRELLYHTVGFDSANVRETIPLSGGAELLISGDDELLQDNAALRLQLQEAQSANAAKEAFLSNMSHDIRTPMNAIIGMTTLAKNHIDEKARVADALGKIDVASSHLLSLINDVLDMSRINSGHMSISSELFSLSDLLHDTLAITRPQAVQKGHAFRFSAGDILKESLRGDALRLRQIFVNIINNAVKYTPAGGEIVITASQEMQEDDRCLLVFRCRDNGIGMSEEFLQKIFDPFERVNSSTISKIEGTGLGMSIVKKLVEAMDGTIHVASKPGFGTTVTVKVPLAYETLQISTSALAGCRLLIVEADEAMRPFYDTYLQEFGLYRKFASTFSEAISSMTDAEFRNEPFTAVILGRDLGGADLFELASYLRKSNPSLPIVLVSEHQWDEIEYRASRSGIDHFIPIPFFRKSLINGLNEALRAIGPQDSVSATPELSGRRILLVEDNDINREIACEILSITNAAVDTAVNGQEAVERFSAAAEGWYDMILMDVQMPVMDGYAATRAIRALPRADANVKIYAMTANAFAEDVSRARAAGMDGHIAKPIDINVLMQVLRQIQ